MSVWCEVSGSIEGKNLSVRKAIKEAFGDEVIINNSVGLPSVRFSFCADGDDAYNYIKTFIAALDSYDAKYDFSTDIRWLK